MAVYLDLVLLLNFVVDFLLLLGTNRLTGFPAGVGRAAAAAVLGAVYSGMCLMRGFLFLGGTVWRLIFLVLMGLVAFGMNPSALSRTGIFVLLSMAMGGIAMGFGKGDFWMLLLSGCIVLCLCHVGFGKRAGGREYIPLTVTEGDRSATVVALRDTGNSLRDPISGEQVVILDAEAAVRLTGLSRQQLSSPLETMLANPGQGYRLISYSALGQSGGILLAKRYRQVKIGDRQGSRVIAFAPQRIGQGEVYQALTGGCV